MGNATRGHIGGAPVQLALLCPQWKHPVWVDARIPSRPLGGAAQEPVSHAHRADRAGIWSGRWGGDRCARL